METRGRTQGGSGDRNESSSGDEAGDGIEDEIGEGKKRKKPHNSCRRDEGNGRDLGVKKKEGTVDKKGLVL